MIVGCKFNKSTAEYGCGLLMQQDCYLILHGTDFLECKTTGNGGCAYLCGGSISYSKENKDFTGHKLEEVDIQYCCFNRCISQRGNDEWNGYGASAMIAGKVVKLLFSTSTSHFQSKQDDQRSRGAQFDILIKCD